MCTLRQSRASAGKLSRVQYQGRDVPSHKLRRHLKEERRKQRQNMREISLPGDGFIKKSSALRRFPTNLYADVVNDAYLDALG